jgi:hypothetical protein
MLSPLSGLFRNIPDEVVQKSIGELNYELDGISKEIG